MLAALSLYVLCDKKDYLSQPILSKGTTWQAYTKIAVDIRDRVNCLSTCQRSFALDVDWSTTPSYLPTRYELINYKVSNKTDPKES